MRGWSVSLAMSLCLLSAAQSCAESLDDLRARGVLRWGADQEGGGPYVYPDADDPNRQRGFEVELAEVLAAKLHVRAQFVQGQWDKLPDLLGRGDLDIVLNGYEWTPHWQERYGVSIPYYVYELQLLARADDESLRSIDDLRTAGENGRRRVGVLGGSAAQTYLEQRFGDDVEVVSFDGSTDAMRAVELGIDGIDATLQDTPIVNFYESGFPALRRVGSPVGRGYYVMLCRQEDQELLAAINEAIISSLRDGSLREVLQHYGLWDSLQQSRSLETDARGNYLLTQRDESRGTDPESEYQPVSGSKVVLQRMPLLRKGALITIQLAVLSMPLAIAIGLVIAVMRLYGPWPMARLATLYIEIVRGTPLVLQLYVIYFLLPEIGINLHKFWAAVAGLAINYSAYEAEIYRSGLQAIPRGQWEAAQALGMSRWLTLRRIVVPQATRIVIPPMTNDFIALFKDTAVCSVITVIELSKQYYIHARSTGAVIELGIATALFYLAMSYPLALLTGYLEKRLRQDRRE